MNGWRLVYLAIAGVFLLQAGTPPVPLAEQGSEELAGAEHDARALPFYFETNRGQATDQVKFLARGLGYTLFLLPTQAVFTLPTIPWSRSLHKRSWVSRLIPPATVSAVRMTLGDIVPAKVLGVSELAGKVNYFRGNDPGQWHTNIPTYAGVKYEDVRHGVDLLFYSGRGQLEYDFVVAPGADPRAITVTFSGASSIKIDDHGDLVLSVPGASLTHGKPIAYQEIAGRRSAVPAEYVLKESGQVGFRLGAYDPSRPLVIDPVLVFSTFLGSGGIDIGQDIEIDPSGNAYVTGWTNSTAFPTQNAFQAASAGDYDVFVTKLNATGSALVYSTYLGGSAFDMGQDLALDSSGSAYVTGLTASTDFPTASPFQSTKGGGTYDVFVTKLNATGSALVYSTYLGGSGNDGGLAPAFGIVVDGAGNAYVTGHTDSVDFPTVNPVQPNNAGGFDVFVTKFNAAGSALVYSTYLGGAGADMGNDVAVDGSSNAYVTGETQSTNFPTANAIQPTPGSNPTTDAFVTKLNATGASLIYSTYLGGNGTDHTHGIAVDASGSAYVTGVTYSPNYPVVNAYQPVNEDIDAVVSKISPTGSALVYSTHLGGPFGLDWGFAIAVDGAGNAYVTGYTRSNSFPLVNPIQSVAMGGNEVFVTQFNASGSALLFSTYLGSGLDEVGEGIAVDVTGNIYVAGRTDSALFPVTASAFQTAHAGGADGFVAKVGASAGGGACAGTGTLRISGRIRIDARKPVSGVSVSLSGPGSCKGTATTDARGSYRFQSLASGIYTVTPSKTGCTFTPASRTVTLSTTDARADFTASCP